VVCRHVTQMVPQPERMLREIHRVLRRGAWAHVLSEDYGMFPRARWRRSRSSLASGGGPVHQGDRYRLAYRAAYLTYDACNGIQSPWNPIFDPRHRARPA
jgi:hypothetical protein